MGTVRSRLRALIAKEFLIVFKDRKSRIILVAPPLIQILVFSYAATFDVWNVRLAVLNEDSGLASRELVSRFTASPNFRPVKRLAHRSEIAAVLTGREALMVLHIGESFSRDLHLAAEAGQADPAQVQILVDGRQSNTAQVAVGYARTIVNDFARARARAAGLSGPPAALDIRAWFNPNLRSQWFIVPGITATLVLIIAIQVTALSVAREREMGTFEQLLVTPLRPVEILIGKMAPALVIGIAEGVAIVTIAHAWFGVPLNGSLWIIAAGMLAFIFAVIGVGLMISSISQTQQQAILGVFLFVVHAVILSGFATPIENIAQWVQSLAYLNPVRYILIIMRGQMLEDMPLQTAVQNIWPLFVIALVSLAVAQWMFRRRLQ